jgi:RND family efflux transporter MFP subunit
MKSLLILALVAAPAFAEGPAPDTAAIRPVVSEVLSPTSAGALNFVGEVAAKTETDLAFLLIGTVSSRPVEVGDLVKSGDLIAQLDPEELDSNLRASAAGVAVARAQLRSATDSETRARELLQRGVDTTTKLEDATRALTAAEAQLDQALAAQARAQDARSYATLRAPQDGVITNVFAEAGATLAAGQPIARLASISEREVVVDMSTKFLAALSPDTLFSVSLDSARDVRTTATLARIDTVAESATRTRRLHLTMDNPPAAFRLGALAHVSIEDTGKAGLSVPVSAVLNAQGQTLVWVVDRASDTVSTRVVRLGETFDDRISVVDGLLAGEEIVLKGVNSLREGQTVGPQVIE